jgi:hypothetical protein
MDKTMLDNISPILITLDPNSIVIDREQQPPDSLKTLTKTITIDAYSLLAALKF